VNVTLLIAIAGIIGIGLVGLVGRRKPAKDLSEWTVAGRRFGAATTWFLQGGEIFTTFTFLGMSGLAFSAGAASFYALAYDVPGYALLFFLVPRIWRIAKRRGYLSQADFLEGEYHSRALGMVAAVAGIVFLLPYLQLQITGLGVIVEIATGAHTSSTLSMIIATVLVIMFVMWSGIHGVARTAYVKDALMVVVMLVIAVVLPLQVSGGISGAFHEVARKHADLLYIHSGDYGPVWYLSNVGISVVGVAFLTLPHLWPGVLSSRSEQALRRNYAFLPLYDLLLVIPVILGFVAFLMLPGTTAGNDALLTLVNRALPDWAVGMVVVAGAATAMVPSAAILVGMSSLLSRNVVRVKSDRGQLRVTRLTVVVAGGLALLLALVRPDLLANLLLLTFSGLAQLAPAIGVAGLSGRKLLHAPAAIAGLAVGVVTVAVLALGEIDVFSINEGVIGLAANLLVCAVVEWVWRSSMRRTAAQPSKSAAPAGATVNFSDTV
jgi:SSS family solute:Na+ symporter